MSMDMHAAQNRPIRLDIDKLRQAMTTELASRRCGTEGFSYAEVRGGAETLYGITGAVNIMAALGLPLGDRDRRRDAAARILRYQDTAGRFHGSDGPGHAVLMVVGALNLLGEPVSANLAPLAPTDPAALSDWLERLDWTSTHKELCGQTIPLLASCRVGADWTAAFVRNVEQRLDSARPLETWCSADAPPWRVISCVYHVLAAFITGRLPYPQPEMLLRRLLGLRWEDADDAEPRTFCTDGDWALLLLRLCEAVPDGFAPAMSAIRRVSARRVHDWHANRDTILSASTHHLWCYLWVTAVFQAAVRDHYAGGVVIDTLNDPALFRLYTI